MSESVTGSPANLRDPLLERLHLATAGTYDIAGELGRGGMAVVFTGTDLKLQRRVAIKVMDPRLSMTPGMAERFLQEARIAARLQHPNIIVVHDVRQNDDIIFFVMSLIDGIAVDELCRQPEPLPIDQIRWILLQSARALAYAHAEGIVHRDIKPANILLNQKGDVVLTDFGIAKALGDTGLTQSGMQVGTPMYMSPEQFSGIVVGPPSDQYALGVMAYQMITGRAPFSGDLYQLIAAHGNRVPDPIRDHRPDCPAFLANAVTRMLEKRPEDRWPSLDDLQEVFGANMPMDGGMARRELAQKVRELRPLSARDGRPHSGRTPADSSQPSFASPAPARNAHDTLIVTISPPGATVFVSGVLELRASVSMDTGQSLPGAGVEWVSSDPGVLAVQPNGTVTGVAPGSAVVRATVNGGWSEATIRVEAAPIARLSMSAPQLTLRVGDVFQPEVTAVDVNGIARHDIAMSWISRSPTVADLTAPGTVRAIAPGTAIIDVTAGNVRRSFDVAVLRRPVSSLRIRPQQSSLELGDASVLLLEAFDDLGQPADVAAARWTSSAPSVIHVDSTGCALAIAAGHARVTAVIDDATHSVDLVSLEPPIGSIQLNSPVPSVEIGETIALSIRVKDVQGNSRSTAGVRVWSSAPEIMRVDAEGSNAVAVGIGEVTLHASPVGDDAPPAATASVTLTVLPVQVARLELFPSTLDLEMGSVAAVHLAAFDRRSRPIPNVNIVWSSDLPQIAAMEGDSAVRGLSQGRCEILATVTNADGTSCTATLAIRVRRASAARLTVTAERSMLEVGEQASLRAVTWDASDTEVTDAIPLWRSTHPAIARVEGNGVVYALAPGRVTITAELDGKSGQLAMLIAPSSIASIAITPNEAEGIVGVPMQFTATALDRNGHSATPALQWSVEPRDAAQPSDTGQVTPLKPVTFTVRASIPVPTDATGILRARSALDASATVRARSAKVLSVEFASASASLVVGKRLHAEVRSRTDAETSVPPAALTWRSEDSAIATVDANGMIIAVAPGETRVTVETDGLEASLMVTVTDGRVSSGSRRGVVLVGGALAVGAIAWLAWPAAEKSGERTGPAEIETVTASTDTAAQAVSGSTTSAPPPTTIATAPAASPSLPATAQAVPPTPTKESVPVPTAARSREKTAAATSLATTVPKAGTPQEPRPIAVGDARPVGAAPSPVQAPVTTSNAASTPTVLPPPPVRSPVEPEGPVTAVSTPAPPVAELPSSAELRAVAEQIMRDVRGGSLRPTAELKQFFGDGAEHKVAVGAISNAGDAEQGRVRAQFELALSRFNSGGALERRVTVVRMEVTKRNGVAQLASTAFGPIVKSGGR